MCDRAHINGPTVLIGCGQGNHHRTGTVLTLLQTLLVLMGPKKVISQDMTDLNVTRAHDLARKIVKMFVTWPKITGL